MKVIVSYIDVGQVAMQPRSLASQWYPREMLNAVQNEDMGEMMWYWYLIRNPKYHDIWGKSYGNELGRLTQGLRGRVEGTKTIFFIDKQDILTARWWGVTYARVAMIYWPKKEDSNRVRLAMGGDRVDYPGNCGTPTSNIQHAQSQATNQQHN